MVDMSRRGYGDRRPDTGNDSSGVEGEDGDVDPLEQLGIVAVAAVAGIGLLRRGATPASPAGRAVMKAGSSAASPVIRGAQHLPWPLRPVTSTLVTLSTAAVVRPAALVADGASTLVEATGHSTAGAPSNRGSTQPVRAQEVAPPRQAGDGRPAKAKTAAPTGGAKKGGRASTSGTGPGGARNGPAASRAKKGQARKTGDKTGTSRPRARPSGTKSSSTR